MWQEDYDREEARYRRRNRGEFEEDEGWYDEENPGRWRTGERETGRFRDETEGRRSGRWGTGSRYQSPYQSRGGFERERGGYERGNFEDGEGYRGRGSSGGGQPYRGGREGFGETYSGRAGYYGGEGYAAEPYRSQGSQGYQGSQAYQGFQGGQGFQGSRGYQSGQPGQSEGYRGESRGEGYRGGQSSGGRYGSTGTASRTQDFTGKGPKGWKRSDERIKEDVSEQFARHPDLDPSQVEIRVTDGDVTLTGTVNDRESKRLAEDIAENVQGVKDVTNQIRVTVSVGTTGGYGTTGTGMTGSGTSGTTESEGSRSRSGGRTGATT